MKEKDLINTITSIVGSEFIGDDCAYLKDLGIVITQDSLVEDVHFKRDLITPYQLGFKSVMVNVSDVCASGAKPEYLTISISLPNNVDTEFVEEFYKGAKEASKDVKIVGGDITGSDKIFISITAIGNTRNRKISSRQNAKEGHKIIVSGEHGSSAHGLKLLLKGEHAPEYFINAHLMPVAQREFSKSISTNIKSDYAMTDTSDGLADALMQIAKASNLTLSVDSTKIPHNPQVDMQTVLYGGEDYQLVATVPDELLKNISDYTIIGTVKRGKVGIEIDNKFYPDIDDKLYNHFKEK